MASPKKRQCLEKSSTSTQSPSTANEFDIVVNYSKKVVNGKIISNKNNYACRECDFISESHASQTIRNHIVRLHRPCGKNLSCKLCDFQTDIKYDYEKHVEDFHIGKLLPPKRNIIDGKEFGRATYFCPYCDFTTKYGNVSIKRHIFRFHCEESRDKIYKCEEDGCSFSTKIKRQFTNHSKIHENKLASCLECDSVCLIFA